MNQLKSKQIKTLVNNIKEWTPDRDILEVRDMLTSLKDITKHPLSYISPKDIAKSRKHKTVRLSNLWGIDDQGYCLLKHGSAWDFVVRQYTDLTDAAIEAGGKVADRFFKIVEAQKGIKAREKSKLPWRYTEDMMELVEEAMDQDNIRSVQSYIDFLMFEDFKRKGLIK